MPMGGPGFGPPGSDVNEKLKEPRPKSLREVPSYVKHVSAKTAQRLFYIFMLVWEAKPSLLIMMCFMTVFNGVMPVIQALVGGELLNGLAQALTMRADGETAPLSVITLPLAAMLACQVLRSVANSVSNMVTRISGEYVTNHIKLKIMNKAKDIDLASFDIPDFYERLENANREAGMRPVTVLNSAFSIVSTLISVVSFIAVLCRINAWAPAVVIVISIPSALINFHYRRKNFAYMRRRSRDRREMTYCSDMLVNKDAVKEIRLFGLSGVFIDKYKSVFKRYFEGIKKLIKHEGAWNISLSAVTAAVNFLLLLYFANGVRTGLITEIGDYSVYSGALDSIASGMAALISTTATIYEGTLFIDNMILFMQEKKSIVPVKEPPVPVKRHAPHRIRFENVSFSYPGTKRKVLDGINVTIEPGSTVVLVGLNGAGKTTFIKLLTRLYDPTEGVITLDGTDIREYEPEELYRIFGAIFQDFTKYAFTVRENITIGDVSSPPDPERVSEAAEKSGADGFISALPGGYETPLMRYFDQNGTELSIGQWQKLSIARAFYSDSDIMILDEPTASLDPMAEQEIFNLFDSLRGGKTAIFVSHRLSGATSADKILVMKDGRIAEEGTHEELMKLRGEYHRLFTVQAERYREGAAPGEISREGAAEETGGPDRDSGAAPGGPRHGDNKTGRREEDRPLRPDGTPFRAPFGVVRDGEEENAGDNAEPQEKNENEFRPPFGVMPGR